MAAKFIKIKNSRIKVSSIGEYHDRERNPTSTKESLVVKVSGRERTFWFDSLQEKNQVLDFLDKTLEVV